MTQSSERSRSITEFLSSSSIPKVRHCDSCGTLMGHITAIFHFAGKQWDTGLPVGPEREPESVGLVAHRRAS